MLLPLYGGRIGRCARGIAGACLIDVETLWFNSAVSIVVGKSRRRCFWIPSPGPMCDIWLKLVGAEINFDRRSVLNTHTQNITQIYQNNELQRAEFNSEGGLTFWLVDYLSPVTKIFALVLFALLVRLECWLALLKSNSN